MRDEIISILWKKTNTRTSSFPEPFLFIYSHITKFLIPFMNESLSTKLLLSKKEDSTLFSSRCTLALRLTLEHSYERRFAFHAPYLPVRRLTYFFLHLLWFRYKLAFPKRHYYSPIDVDKEDKLWIRDSVPQKLP